jgi:hypothetical protein
LLIPNPERRPTVKQLNQILDNWSMVQNIKLPQEAMEIKTRQLSQESNFGSSNSSQQGRDLTADDIFKL